MNRSDPPLLTDFILETERNFRIAEMVHISFPTARLQLIERFCEKLGVLLTKKLNGWKWEYWGPFFVERYGALDVWKPLWRDQYRLRLEAWQHGERMIYGIWRNEDDEAMKNRSFAGKILTEVKKVHPSAKARKYYEAEVTLRSPEPDWRRAGVLWRIHTDVNFLNDVAAQMLEVANLTEKIVDSVVTK
jgi:hypothetical protein